MFCNGPPLFLIRIEEGIGSLFVVDECKFPSEVEGILDADVESLAACRAVDVGGVAA